MSPGTAQTGRWKAADAGLVGWAQVLKGIPKEENFACGIPTECGVQRSLSGPGTWPQAVDGPAGQVMDVEDRTLSLRRRPSHLPRGPDCREVGVCIRASAVSHAALCSRETGSQGEAIPGTDPGQTRKPVLGVSPGPALREEQQKPPAERLEPAYRGCCAPQTGREWGWGDPALGGPTWIMDPGQPFLISYLWACH